MSALSRVSILSSFVNGGDRATQCDRLYTPEAARLGKSFRLRPDRTAGKQLNTDGDLVS